MSLEGVYILSDYSELMKRTAIDLGLPDNQIVSVPVNAYEGEHLWHNWTKDLFDGNIIEKIVIPVSLPCESPNTQGFFIALHIRLNYELTLKQRLTPIVFISDYAFENIFKLNPSNNEYNTSYILPTQGVLLSNFDSKNIITSINNVTVVKDGEYKLQVLDKLNVLQKAENGKHSIANAWGCYKLAVVTGMRDRVFKDGTIADKLKTLYSKFLISYNESYNVSHHIDLDPIKCAGKKILYIDDKADEGWALVMKNIFRFSGDGFVSVNSAKYKNSETKLFTDFEGFVNECKSYIGEYWDLIIIDLRLNPEKEDIDSGNILPSELTGYQLLNDFLEVNEGYQIIVSTASNKIWNINAALERGVSSYYIKESPEYNYTITETKDQYKNFKSEVKIAFHKNHLFDIYKSWKIVSELKLLSNSKLIKESDLMLKIAWESLKQDHLDFGYLTLFQIIESYANHYYDYWDNSIIIKNNKEFMIELLEDDKELWKLTYNEDKDQGGFFVFKSSEVGS